MTVRTLQQQLVTAMQLTQTQTELREGYIRIEMIARELLRENPDSSTGKDALELAQNALQRTTSTREVA